MFLQKSISGKRYRASLLFPLWSSKHFQAPHLQLEDLICYCNTYLSSISDVSIVHSTATAAQLFQASGCFPSTETAAVVPQALLMILIAYIYLLICHVICRSGENMSPKLWRRHLSHDDCMSLTLLLQKAIVTASVAGQTSLLFCYRIYRCRQFSKFQLAFSPFFPYFLFK